MWEHEVLWLVVRALLPVLAASRQVVPHDHHCRHWLVQATVMELLGSVLVLLLVAFFVAVAAAMAAYCVHFLVL